MGRHWFERNGECLVCAERCVVVEVFEFMTVNQALFPLKTMALTSSLSRSGYYAWLVREPSAHTTADAALTDRIKRIHAASKETYGASRIHAELAETASS